MNVTLERKGTFQGKTHTPTQCGETGKKQYWYIVQVTCTDKDISDKDGFIVDNSVIFDYFRIKYELKESPCVSCELIAVNAVKEIKKLIWKERKIVPDRIKVSIGGSEHSFLTAEA